MEAIPENGGEDHEAHDREDEVIEELGDESRGIGTDEVGQLSVWVLFEDSSDGEIAEVIDDRRSKERDRGA